VTDYFRFRIQNKSGQTKIPKHVHLRLVYLAFSLASVLSSIQSPSESLSQTLSQTAVNKDVNVVGFFFRHLGCNSPGPTPRVWGRAAMYSLWMTNGGGLEDDEF
jgi:hypothetical protein